MSSKIDLSIRKWPHHSDSFIPVWYDSFDVDYDNQPGHYYKTLWNSVQGVFKDVRNQDWIMKILNMLIRSSNKKPKLPSSRQWLPEMIDTVCQEVSWKRNQTMRIWAILVVMVYSTINKELAEDLNYFPRFCNNARSVFNRIRFGTEWIITNAWSIGDIDRAHDEKSTLVAFAGGRSPHTFLAVDWWVNIVFLKLLVFALHIAAHERWVAEIGGMLIRNEFSCKEKIEKVNEEHVIPSDKLLKLLERQWIEIEIVFLEFLVLDAKQSLLL